MLKTVQTFFSNQIQSGDADQTTEHGEQLAAAALLFEVSRSDHDIDETEKNRIEEIVRSRFDLSAEEVQTVMELAEQEVHDASSLYGFTSLINDHWSIDQRVHLAELMWQVAFADGRLDDHEVHLMRKIQKLLHIPHKRFIGAKLQAREEADAPSSDPDLRAFDLGMFVRGVVVTDDVNLLVGGRVLVDEP
ncbi:MAG: TerB family tellurite resistance protein [Gammaproteobacteria bacterium]|nr:TerB family tellurite resistance protein [Gammaproteobacteria bacterium]